MFGSKTRRIAQLERELGDVHLHASNMEKELDRTVKDYDHCVDEHAETYRQGILWAVDEMIAQADGHKEGETLTLDNIDHVRACASDLQRRTQVPHVRG